MATRKKKNNIGAFGHPIYGKGFAKYGEMRPNGSSEIPNYLEEAADEGAKQYYIKGGYSPFPNIETNAYKAGFFAGSKWQEEQDQETIELAEDHAFLAGSEWQKEQMLKEALEGEVCIPNVWVEHKEGKELVVRAEISKKLGFKFGDKVRIIIVKEDEK